MDNYKEKFKTYLEVHEVLTDLARDWIEEFGYHVGDNIRHVLIQVDNEKYPPIIEAEYTYYDSTRNCPGEYTADITIPLSVFWDTAGAFERERKDRQEANVAAVREQQEKDAKRSRLDKADRYETYLDLCKEFENGK